MGKVLTDAAVRRYARDGFLGPVDMFSRDEAAGLRRRIEAVEAKLGGEIQRRYRIKAHLPFPWLCDVVRHSRLLDAVEDIIGPDILCWGASFFQKDAHDPRFVSWHQDGSAYLQDPPHTLTAWIAITDSTLESGCVRFIPGTHGKGIFRHGMKHDPDNILSRGQHVRDVDVGTAVPMVLRAGQLSFHREDTVHGSDPNMSDDRRIGLSIHYVSPDIRPANVPGATAMLLRGTDTHGHWGRDPWPHSDWDPDCLAALEKTWDLYHSLPLAAES
jgi:chlorinating enzyme